jgi:hypothetical protein
MRRRQAGAGRVRRQREALALAGAAGCVVSLDNRRGPPGGPGVSAVGINQLVDLSTGTLTKAGATGVALDLPRRDVFIWVSAILFSNQLLSVVKETPSASPEQLLSDLAAVGAFQLMAWYAIFRLFASSEPTPIARLRDLLIAVALCFLVFVPSTRTIWVAALGAGIYAWLFHGGDLKARAAGLVLAALSVQEFWGRIVFKLFAFPLLRAETAVVGTILQAVRPGTAGRGTSSPGRPVTPSWCMISAPRSTICRSLRSAG